MPGADQRYPSKTNCYPLAVELFPRDENTGFLKFRAVGRRRRDFNEFCIVPLGVPSLARELSGMGRAVECIESIRAVLQDDLVFLGCFRRPLQFDKQVGEHFASGDRYGV